MHRTTNNIELQSDHYHQKGKELLA